MFKLRIGIKFFPTVLLLNRIPVLDDDMYRTEAENFSSISVRRTVCLGQLGEDDINIRRLKSHKRDKKITLLFLLL